jgi:tRNA A37 N6-isopentenylltransferase MiaA
MMMRGSMMMGGSMLYPLCPMMGHSALDKADKGLTDEQRKKVQKLSGGMMHQMKDSPSDMEKMHEKMHNM